MSDDQQNEHVDETAAPEDPDSGAVPAYADVLPEPKGWFGRLKAGWPFTPELHVGRPHVSSALVRWLAAGLFAAFTLGSAGVAFATYDYDQRYRGRILPGATVGAVDIGGLTRGQAISRVRAAIEPELSRTITLRWRHRTWKVTPRELGARNDARGHVEAALRASGAATFIDKARMRVLGANHWFVRDVGFSYPRKAALAFLRGLASGFDREPRDATVDYSTGWVEVVPEQGGRFVRVKPTFEKVRAALETRSDTVELAVKTQPAKVTTKTFDQVLLLRIGENKLYLYEDGEITQRWTVATGLPEYPTPTGLYEIELKRYMPTWVNPDPEGWGADMPASIPPGPGNPLGLRALNWTAPAIRFHGTSATYSLGYNASHGCVRMANEDVIQLYDLVDVGTPIVSTIVAPFRPLYSSAPDPTVVSPN